VTRWVAAGICAYEVGAIATGRLPTVTQLCARHRALGPALITALVIHLYRQRHPAAGGRP
jgi:hypothetical protein